MTRLIRPLVLCALLAAFSGASLHAQTLSLHDSTVVRFATAEESRLRLGSPDAFVAAMGPYDRSARTGRAGAVSESEYLAFAAAQALDWSAADLEKFKALVERVAQRLKPLNLPLPKEVWLVKTTGREEAETAYTRGNAIIMPRWYSEAKTEDVERIFIHELFHVISRSAPARRDALYAIVGYRDCGPFDWPPELAQRRITNPDAPDDRYCITLQRNGAPLTFYPALLAREEQYDPALPGTFIDRLAFKLIAVMGSEKKWMAGRGPKNELVLLDPGALPEYYTAIGLNTRYVIHPEEILADNFVLLVRDEKNVRTPRIVTELGRVLAQK